MLPSFLYHRHAVASEKSLVNLVPAGTNYVCSWLMEFAFLISFVLGAWGFCSGPPLGIPFVTDKLTNQVHNHCTLLHTWRLCYNIVAARMCTQHTVTVINEYGIMTFLNYKNYVLKSRILGSGRWWQLTAQGSSRCRPPRVLMAGAEIVHAC